MEHLTTKSSDVYNGDEKVATIATNLYKTERSYQVVSKFGDDVRESFVRNGVVGLPPSVTFEIVSKTLSAAKEIHEATHGILLDKLRTSISLKAPITSKILTGRVLRGKAKEWQQENRPDSIVTTKVEIKRTNGKRTKDTTSVRRGVSESAYAKALEKRVKVLAAENEMLKVKLDLK